MTLAPLDAALSAFGGGAMDIEAPFVRLIRTRELSKLEGIGRTDALEDDMLAFPRRRRGLVPSASDPLTIEGILV